MAGEREERVPQAKAGGTGGSGFGLHPTDLCLPWELVGVFGFPASTLGQVHCQEVKSGCEAKQGVETDQGHLGARGVFATCLFSFQRMK